MSGPSATEKPRSAKIAVISSITWLIGWMRPRTSGASRRGSVTSMRSAESRASRAASVSASRLARIAPCTRSRRPLMRGPRSRRSSGVIAPSVLRSSETLPFLPRAATRRASRLASSPARSICPRRSRSRASRSITAVLTDRPRAASGAAFARRRATRKRRIGAGTPGEVRTRKTRRRGARRAAPCQRVVPPLGGAVRRPSAGPTSPSRRRRRRQPARGWRARTGPCGPPGCRTWPARR